jgi:hypothetical protein
MPDNARFSKFRRCLDSFVVVRLELRNAEWPLEFRRGRFSKSFAGFFSPRVGRAVGVPIDSLLYSFTPRLCCLCAPTPLLGYLCPGSLGRWRIRFGLWLGWPYLRIKAQGPWHKGACFDFLPSFRGAFYTKSARRSRQVPGQFPNRLEVIHKNVSDWFYK